MRLLALPHMAKQFDVAVIGAGIAGLTAAALLQHDGVRVLLLEAHDKPGGCAGYFPIRDFSFDAGATVALGFEPGGLHRRVFDYVGYTDYQAQLLEGLRMLLPDRELMIWHDPIKWKAARRTLPGHRLTQELFWHLLEIVADASWRALERLPSLPLQTSRDWMRNLKLLNPKLAPLAPFLRCTMGDILRWLRLEYDRAFLAVINLLLIITVQEEAACAPFINACAGMDLFRHGGFHLRGGMGAIARHLLAAFQGDGGVVRFSETVCRVLPKTIKGKRSFSVITAKGEYEVPRVVANVPLQSVPHLADLPPRALRNACRFEERGGEGWGAVTLYAAVRETAVPAGTPLHQQVLLDYAARSGDGRDIFLSLSAPGDNEQAPNGWRTLTVSSHTRLGQWRDLSLLEYRERKRAWREKLLQGVRRALPEFDARRKFIITGTPKTWEGYTRRPAGAVGGVPLTLRNTNLNAIPQRLGLRNLWVVGDTTFPGQGTVACALSGINAWRDITGKRGIP